MFRALGRGWGSGGEPWTRSQDAEQGEGKLRRLGHELISSRTAWGKMEGGEAAGEGENKGENVSIRRLGKLIVDL